VDRYRERDPLALFQRRVLAERRLTEGDLREAQVQVETEIDAAARFAAAAAPPRPEECLEDVYVSYAGSLR
jgi:TPP-dependent pyruvate/acetoin dehydrogenase alpha subunit